MNRTARAALQQRIDTLEKRLNNGYEQIDARKAQGLDVSKLEDFWIQLLHEYEDALDAIDALYTPDEREAKV